MMNQIEKNIIASFDLVKEDFAKLQQEVVIMRITQRQLEEQLKVVRSRERLLKAQVRKAKVVKTAKKTRTLKRKFVASKEGKKFHTVNCPFAKNIKPKHKQSFASKVKPLNNGLKPCKCVA